MTLATALAGRLVLAAFILIVGSVVSPLLATSSENVTSLEEPSLSVETRALLAKVSGPSNSISTRRAQALLVADERHIDSRTGLFF